MTLRLTLIVPWLLGACGGGQTVDTGVCRRTRALEAVCANARRLGQVDGKTDGERCTVIPVRFERSVLCRSCLTEAEGYTKTLECFADGYVRAYRDAQPADCDTDLEALFDESYYDQWPDVLCVLGYTH